MSSGLNGRLRRCVCMCVRERERERRRRRAELSRRRVRE